MNYIIKLLNNSILNFILYVWDGIAMRRIYYFCRGSGFNFQYMVALNQFKVPVPGDPTCMQAKHSHAWNNYIKQSNIVCALCTCHGTHVVRGQMLAPKPADLRARKSTWRWKERTNSTKLFSDFHMYTMACIDSATMHTCTYVYTDTHTHTTKLKTSVCRGPNKTRWI